MDPSTERFEAFVREHEPPLRLALVARYGPERGRDAAAEALAHAWLHRDRVLEMERPVGYLYRVGQSKSRRSYRQLRPATPREPGRDTHVEPALVTSLDALTERQRVALVLCAGYDWTLQEVADLLGISRSSVQRHLDRAMAKVRGHLGITEPTIEEVDDAR